MQQSPFLVLQANRWTLGTWHMQAILRSKRSIGGRKMFWARISIRRDDNPCAERWRNKKTEVTARMWGIFEETGLFLSLCRHGFVLLLADMVRSGER